MDIWQDSVKLVNKKKKFKNKEISQFPFWKLHYIDIPKSVPAWHLRWRRLQEGERNRKTLSFMLSVKQVKRFSVPLLFQLINQSDLKSLTEIHTSSYLHHSTKCNVQCISLHTLKPNLNNKYKARSFEYFRRVLAWKFRTIIVYERFDLIPNIFILQVFKNGTPILQKHTTFVFNYLHSGLLDSGIS